MAESKKFNDPSYPVETPDSADVISVQDVSDDNQLQLTYGQLFSNISDVYVSIDAEQDITGKKNFTGGLEVDGSTPITSISEGSGSDNEKLITQGYADESYEGGVEAFLAIQEGLQHPTGFPNRDDSEVTYDIGTKTISIGPKVPATEFKYFLDGVEYTIDSVQTPTAHDDTTGLYFFYWNAANELKFNTTIFNILTDVPIAYVFYSTDSDGGGTDDGYLAEERHGSNRNPAAHLELHETLGTYIPDSADFTIGNYVEQPGAPIDSDNQFSLTEGEIADEDIRMSLPALPAVGPYTIFYRIGGSGAWQWTKTATVPITTAIGTKMDYNQDAAPWQRTQSANNSFVNMWVFKTTSTYTDLQTIIFMGQSNPTTLVEALSEDVTELDFGTIPLVEYSPLYKITFGIKGTYTSTGECRIESVERLLGTKVSVIQGSQSNHDALSGLELAQAGETWGHINDAVQTIAGEKTFIENVNAATFTATSTVAGNLPPRMTDAQRKAIAAPVEGETIYNTDSNLNAYEMYNPNNPNEMEDQWEQYGGNVEGITKINGYYDNSVICTFDSSTDLVQASGHGLTDDDMVSFKPFDGALPPEIMKDNRYYVVNALTNSFQISKILSGSPLDFTEDGTVGVNGPVFYDLEALPSKQQFAILADQTRYILYPVTSKLQVSSATRWPPNNLKIDDNFYNRSTEPPILTGDISTGSSIIENIDTDKLEVNMVVSGDNIPVDSTIVSVDSETQITISDNATATDTGIELIFNQVGDTTLGSAVIDIINTDDIKEGMVIEGVGIPTDSTVISIDSDTQITISENATVTDTGVLLIFYQNKFIENTLPVNNRQENQFRIRASYTMTPSGADEIVKFELKNPLSGFALQDESVIQKGLAAGNLTFNAISISDNLSFGNGYTFSFTPTDDMIMTVVDVTRFSRSVSRLQI
jgi:hypothetical protein